MKKLFLALALIAVGILLFTADTDREYINLAPTEGIDSGLILEAGTSYQQDFIARRTSLTRLGLFFRPVAIHPGDDSIEVNVLRGSSLLATRSIPASVIDAEGAAQVRFDPPLATEPGEVITITIAVPAELSGAVRLQQRELDATFDASNVTLTVNDAAQAAPAAYQIYARYHPTLALYLGGLLILGSVLTLLPYLPVYVLGLPAIFCLPIALQGGPTLLLYITSLAALSSMLLLLRRAKFSLLPALIGAHAFAFTSWFSLQLLGERETLLLAAFLPLVFSLARRPISRPRNAALASFVTAGPASIRDIFFDTNQVVAATKVAGVSWDHFGSYLGALSGSLGLIGLIWCLSRADRGRLPVGALGLLGILLVYASLPYFIIFTTFALAYFAAAGAQALQHYLQPHPHQRRGVVTLVLSLLALIALLDLWQVAAASWEYSLL
ncbi:MAG TPA: hypothetical protein VJC05_03050 [Candidatus Andersenbacteria bacterium]|nr:MAG: hypothetical protein A2854_01950 [Parcubacteria group bacterium RIFCSPHIGHO2_01_FULL_56_18]HLD25992.1 hypothetical protein [Candidatus Andersenbacteria bacterium]